MTTINDPHAASAVAYANRLADALDQLADRLDDLEGVDRLDPVVWELRSTAHETIGYLLGVCGVPRSLDWRQRSVS